MVCICLTCVADRVDQQIRPGLEADRYSAQSSCITSIALVAAGLSDMLQVIRQKAIIIGGLGDNEQDGGNNQERFNEAAKAVLWYLLNAVMLRCSSPL